MADYTPEQFAASVLDRLGIPQTRGALQALVGWQRAEGGHWNNNARYNPLNTTQNMPGSGDTGSQGNISVYRNWDQGVNATVQTLKNGHYGSILSALQAGNPNAVAKAIDSSPWGTHGDLVYRTIAGTKAPRNVALASSSSSAGSSPLAGGAEQVAPPAPPQDPGTAGNFTGLLQALVAKPQQQAPQSSLGPLQPAGGVALPQGFRGLAPTAQEAPQQEPGVSQALGLLETLRGTDPASGTSGQNGTANGPGILDKVMQERANGVQSQAATNAPLSDGGGAFEISGPNPGRLQPNLTSFAEKVAQIYGGSLVGKDGSTHSKFTVNGNVSQHWTGNATDIFEIDGKPAQGKLLLQAGRAALIAAGMPRKQALKQTGGLFNVGSHQIIFLTNQGGNHFDHLHISAR